MAHEHTIRRRVEFSETDMAGIVHFSRFFRYMETAEHAFFRSLGFSIVTRIGDRSYGWPRVHAECDYHAPLAFEERFEVKLRVREIRSRSLIYDFVFTRLVDEEPADVVARGSLTAVCVTEGEDGTMQATPLPREITERIEPAPAEPSD